MSCRLACFLMSTDLADHSYGAKDIMKAGIDVYVSQGTIDTLRLTGHRVHQIKALESFSVGSWTILPFDTVHDAAEPLGFLLANREGEKLLFVTDSHFSRYRFRGLTHIAIEINYELDLLRQNIANGITHPKAGLGVLSRHMNLETANRFFAANDMSRVEQIHLLHLSDNSADAIRFKNEIQKLVGRPVYVA